MVGPGQRTTSSFLDLLRSGVPLAGTVIASPDPVLAERVAQRFQFVWIDMEHSALGIRDAQVLAIAVRAGGAAAVIRLPRADSELLGAILDMGVDGIVAPQVNSAAEVSQLVGRLRYPPAGSRGFAPRRRVESDAVASAGDLPAEISCLVQIETQAALGAVDAIAAVDGVHALVLGTADLSMALGCTFDLESAQLASAGDAVGLAAKRHGKSWGLAATAIPSWGERVDDDGPTVFVMSSDLRLYSQALDTVTERLATWASGGHPSSPGNHTR
jgi:2-keto-3-deoxy-L-rhamnonate aldolase RhmA